MSIRLEQMVPADHILRRIGRRIDFSFIETQTTGLYSHTGRPSIDPQVLIRMMLIGYLFGITSERRLCQEVHLNLAYRWFCGLSLEDKVADHSTFTKNRNGRFKESDIFRQMFYAVVQQAMEAGLVKGRHLTVDATTIKANASLDSMEPIVVSMSAESYLSKVEEQNPQDTETKGEDKEPPTGGLSNDTHHSRSDPEARLQSKRFGPTQMAYSANVLMDNKHRVILEVEVSEPSVKQEAQMAALMVQRSRFSSGINPQSVGGDKAYGYGAAVSALLEAGVEPHVPARELNNPNDRGVFKKERFIYDAQTDQMICPAAQRMKRRTEHQHNRMTEYAASVKVCRSCPLKSQCTRARYRVVHRHWDEEALKIAQELRSTKAYRLSQRCRKRIEHLFAEAKEQMGLRRAMRRGKRNLTEQCLMTAMAQNIKRIVAALEKLPSKALAAAKTASESALESFASVLASCRRQLEQLLRRWIASARSFGWNSCPI